jgi:CheY-like chemotaxis protein
LVVDDDLWIQRTTAAVLGQRGHQVALAGDAPSAFALGCRIRPHLVITSVALPALDGWPWWEQLRAVPACAHIPFLFLLPQGDASEDVFGALSQDLCLRKPFRLEQLEQAVVLALGDRAMISMPREPGVPGDMDDEPPPRPPRAVDPTKPSAGHRPLSAFRGEIDQISLSSVLTVLEMERKSGILLVERDDGAARLYFRRGRLIRASTDAPPLAGAPAVYEALTWATGSFDFLAGDTGGVDEIQTSTTYLLMEGARRMDEANEARRSETQRNKL